MLLFCLSFFCHVKIIFYIEHNRQESIWFKYIMQFKEPLILMLLGSAVLSVIVGQVSKSTDLHVYVCLF